MISAIASVSAASGSATGSHEASPRNIASCRPTSRAAYSALRRSVPAKASHGSSTDSSVRTASAWNDPEALGEQLAQQRLLGREVAVEGAHSHVGDPGDLLHRRLHSLLGEDRLGGGHDAVAVALGVGAFGLWPAEGRRSHRGNSSRSRM